MKCSDSQVPSTRSLFNRCLISNNNEKKDNEEDNTSQRCEPLEGKTDKDPSPSKVESFKRLFPSWTPKVLIHSESTKKRSIIVGDIHGCSQELRDLLTRLSFDPAEDTLFHVGDLVGKGPDSHGVVQIMREVGALGVMGNHDWLALRSAGRLEPPLDPDQTSSQPSLGLTDEDLDYLKQLPHMIHLKQFSVLIVHAAVNVVKTCTRTHPFVCMHGRTVDERNRIHPKFNGTPWASKYTGKLHVVFGHDARRGRQEYPNATGLDSGCVYGVSLTAMILPDRTLVSVPSYKVYCQQSAEVNPSLVEDEQEPEEIVQEME